MKVSRLVTFVMIMILLVADSCSIVGGIFKAGMGFGIFLVVAIVIAVLFIARRANKK